MKIYYFGELIEDNGVKVEKQTTGSERQLTLTLENKKEEKKIGMPSIGDLLKDIDLNLENPLRTSQLGV